MIAAVSPVIATNIFFSAQEFSAQNPPIFTEGLSFTLTGSLKAEAHLNFFSTEKIIAPERGNFRRCPQIVS